jgi:16S rRNA (uracil1498-N3)-methyltransferase
MKRFLLPAAPDALGRFYLSGKDYHYLVRVRRLAAGDTFDAFLPAGDHVRVRVLSVDRALLTGQRLVPEEDSPAPDVPGLFPRLVLFQALPKGAKMDLIVRQAAEGGVAEIVPFESGHSVPRLPGSAVRDGPGGEDSSGAGERAKGGRLERWRRIIREARQQSGSSVVTAVRAPCGTAGALAYWGELRNRWPGAAGLLLQPPADTPGASSDSPVPGLPARNPLAKGSFHGYLIHNPPLAAALIGPEGGFSPEEVSGFVAAGFNPVTIGNTVLRTETAALYAMAAIRVILLENHWWTLKIP